MDAARRASWHRERCIAGTPTLPSQQAGAVLCRTVQIAEEHNDIEHNDIVLFTLCASVICTACHAWQSLRIAIATSVQACTPVHARTSARLVVIYFHAEVARVKARGH